MVPGSSKGSRSRGVLEMQWDAGGAAGRSPPLRAAAASSSAQLMGQSGWGHSVP